MPRDAEDIAEEIKLLFENLVRKESVRLCEDVRQAVHEELQLFSHTRKAPKRGKSITWRTEPESSQPGQRSTPEVVDLRQGSPEGVSMEDLPHSNPVIKLPTTQSDSDEKHAEVTGTKSDKTDKSWAIHTFADDDHDHDHDNGRDRLVTLDHEHGWSESEELRRMEDEALLQEDHHAAGYTIGTVRKEHHIPITPARQLRQSISAGQTPTGSISATCFRRDHGHEAHEAQHSEDNKATPTLDPVMPFQAYSSADSAQVHPALSTASPSPHGHADLSSPVSVISVSHDNPCRGSYRDSRPSHFQEHFPSTAENARTCSMRLRALVTSSSFDYAVGALVVLNALSIGMQVDWAARNTQEATPVTYKVINWIFCVLFTVELFLRICSFGRKFFYNADWKWNIFDTVIVCMQLAEELTSAIVDAMFGSELGSEYTNFTLVRVLRVLRLVRIVRFTRILRLIRELHTMVGSIIGSLRSFLWTVVLLFGLIYCVGVLITQIVADHIRAEPDQDLGDPALRRYYGSLGSSVLSLFQALSGGVDWEDLLTPLHLVTDSTLISLFYSAYIAFCMFVMLNLVTGIFVDSAQTNIREDRDLDLVNRVHELFNTADDDHSGNISWQEFKNQLENPDMGEYFKTIDLDMSEAEHLFELLDVHGVGSITSEEFVNGCLRMRGPAKAYDVASHVRWTRKVSQRLLSGIRRLEHQTHLISEELGLDTEEMDRERTGQRRPSKGGRPDEGARKSLAHDILKSHQVAGKLQ